MQREAKLGNSKKKEENDEHPSRANDIDLQASESQRPPSNTQASPIGNPWWTRIKKAFTPERIFTGVIAVAACLQFSVTRLTLHQMRKDSALTRAAVDQATRQANLMEEGLAHSKSAMEASMAQSKAVLDASIQIAQNDQRAWVAPVEVLPGVFTVGSKKMYLVEGHREATFGVVIANSGKSPAFEVKTTIEMRIVKRTDQFKAKYNWDNFDVRTWSVSLIPPGMRLKIITRPTSREPTKTDIELLKTGDLIAYVFGRVEYKDIFDKPHFTNFCLRVMQDLSSMESHGAYNEAN